MYTIRFTGWNENAEKIAFINLLNKEMGVSLKEAKLIKDRIVDDGEMVEIKINDKSKAKEIVLAAIKIGFLAEIVEVSS